MKKNLLQKCILTIVCILIPTILIFSQQNDKSKINAQQVETTGLTEKQAYRMLYDNQVKANDSVLKTIFYALGGLGTALILVFASNWWFNDKKVRDIIGEIDKKVKDLNKDVLAELTEKINLFSSEKTAEIYQMQSKLQEDTTKNIKSLTLKFTDFTDKIRAEIKEDDKELTNSFQKQLELFNENYKQQITYISENISMLSTDLKEIINGKEEILKNLINTEKQATSSQLNSIKGDLYRTAFYMWDGKGVYRNALMSQLDEIGVKVENNYPDLSFYLNHLSETVDKMIELNKSDKDIANIILNKVPEKNKTLAQEIFQKINTLKDKVDKE
jgi:hypothetical protein